MEKKKVKMPSEQIEISIGPNVYPIKQPTNGQLIDIESSKSSLTRGTHSDMLRGASSAAQAYLLTEVISTFNILIPKLKTDLNATSLLDLTPIQTRNMCKVYTEIVYPWLEQIRQIANDEVDVEE